MALQNDTSRIQYNGNGSTTNSYPITFVFFENSHIRCVVTTSAGVDTELALGSGFTVTGAGNQNGGSLRTTTAVPSTSKVTIYRSVPVTQTTSYQEGGAFPAASHEKALDKLTMIAQQTKRLADRALKVPETQANPNDLPNASTGQKILGSNNGTILWKDERQLPATPAASQQMLLVAPGNEADPEWQTAPSIAEGPTLATNKLYGSGPGGSGGATIASIVPRYNSERWGDVINVKDWGAVGDGVTDDWLAIQRAIAHSHHRFDVRNLTDDPSNPNNMETYNPAGVQAGNIQVPKLFGGQGFRTVFFPWGFYAISKPLVISHGVTLLGAGGQKSCLIATPGYYGRLIEDMGNYLERTYWPTRPASHQFTAAGYEFNAFFSIRNFALYGNGNDAPYKSANGGRIITGYDFVRYPLFNEGAITTATGTAGSNTVTLNQDTHLVKQPFLNWRVKFQNHSTEYQVTSFQGNSSVLVLNQNLTHNVPAGTVLLVGIPRHIGMATNGGEDACVEQVSMRSFDVGAFEPYGSPGKTFRDVSCWGCDVGLWLDTSPGLVTKLSGDSNNVWVRAGLWNTISATIMGIKAESAPKDTFRAFIEHRTEEQSTSSSLSIIGATFNGGYVTTSGGDGTWQNRALIEIYRKGNNFTGNVNVTGINPLSNCQYFARLSNSINGNVENLWPRDSSQSGDQSFYLGSPARNAAGYIERFLENGYNGRLTPIKYDTTEPGKPVFIGAGFLLDGEAGLLGTGTMTRSGTTVTVTTAIPHGMAVGDYCAINAYPYSGLGLSYPEFDSGGLHNAYYNGTVKVQSVINATTFTLYGNNSGPTGDPVPVPVMVWAMRFTELHAINRNEHRFQMPHVLGRTDNQYTGFGFYDKLRRMIAGIRVPEQNKGFVWASGGLSVGGTIGSPLANIVTGTMAPTSSAPNGSLYLRTDGDASTTLYVRANNSWKPLASYEP